jgi:two-component system, chemotaxis family, sensor kinase CheA
MSDGAMQKNFIETLWREFGVEVEEHLGVIETMLVRADHEILGHQDVAALFRAFHSLKGITRAMDIRGMEAIAHAAENLLGLVREGRLALNATLASLLLPAVDTLRQQLNGAIASRTDQAAPPGLLERLSNAYARAMAGNGLDEPQPVNADAGGAPPAEQDESRELLLFFAQGLRDNLFMLSGILAPASDAAHGAALDAAESIETGAGILDLDALAENMRALREVVAAAPDEQATALLLILCDVHAQAEILAEDAGESTGAEEFSAALAGYLLPELRQRAAALPGHVRQTHEDGECEQGSALILLADLASSHAALWAAYGAKRAAHLLVLFADACAHAARGRAPNFDAIVQIAMDLSNILVPEADAGPGAWDVPVTTADATRVAVSQAMALAPERSDVQGIALSPEQLKALSPAHIEAIRQSIETGHDVYAILAFLEHDAGITHAFTKWLQTSVIPIFNRTVQTSRETGLEFIVTTDMHPNAVAHQLRDMDPAASCLRSVVCLTKPVEHATDTAQSTLTKPDSQPRNASVRIDGNTVTAFVNHSGEVAAAAITLTHIADDPDALAALNALRNHHSPSMPAELRRDLAVLEATWQQLRQRAIALERDLRRLHHAALELRVIPLEPLLTRMSRAVRDLSQAQNKEVRLVVTARDVRVDRGIIEQLAEPILHMVRNAIDHGIESPAERITAGKDRMAQFALRAATRGGEILIEIADDGKGLNPERLRQAAIARHVIGETEARQMSDTEAMRLIFLAGFSTADTVTELSGRGVGMDVALTTISRLGGSIDIDSLPGLGTTFRIRLPVSASLMNAILVSAAGHLLAVPEHHLEEIMEISADAIHDISGRRGLLIRGEFVRLYALGALFGPSDAAPPPGQNVPVLVLRTGMTRTAFLCDRLLRRQEFYLKDLHPRLAAIPGISGATVLDDGRVVLVVEGDRLSDVIEQRQGMAAAT